MDTIKLDITEGVYNSVKEARAASRIPIAYYGKGVENRQFSVDYQEFRRAFEKGGRSTIMTLTNEKGEEFPCLIHEVQYEPVSDTMIHADLKAVDMKKKIHAKIPLVMVGTAPAVKDEGGVLMQNKDSIEVECLPTELVHEIEVDISPLVDFHTSITVGDVKVPEGFTVLDSPEINVATVSAPRAVVEEEAPAEGEEGAEGSEGAEAAEGGEAKEEGGSEGGEEAKGE